MERILTQIVNFVRHDVIVVYVYVECANENHTLSSIMTI